MTHRNVTTLFWAALLLLGAGGATARVARLTQKSPPALDPAVSGKYDVLGVAPIAAAHAMELPCGRDRFLLMEFGPTGVEGKLMLPHPPENPNGEKPLWLWDRANATWTHVPTKINSICGGWARYPSGSVGFYAGHYQTLEYKQTFGMNRIVVYDATLGRTVIKGNLTAQRWYPTALNLPNGEVWVPGGTFAQKPNGTWPKAEGADIHNPAEETVRRVPLNARLFGAGLGNWYMGSRVLPSGKVATMNMNMMQVIDAFDGSVVAEAPPLPSAVKDVVWEFPRMGSQVMLQQKLAAPGAPQRFEFAAFGGSTVDAALRAELQKCGPTSCDREKGEARPCSDKSVRIGVTVHPDGRHVFDPEWEVEQMPGPRCIMDGVLLPNGHVVILGGQRRGIGDLTNDPTYNGGHEPYAHPWLYRPDAPKGERFAELAAATKIPRLYHAVAQLTSRGDILATGTSNAGFWESSESAEFKRTQIGVNEYRQEIFSPPYLFRPGRPAFAADPPSWAAYGGEFDVAVAGGASGAAATTGVTLVEPGGTTHNYAIGHRSQLLRFAPKKGAAGAVPGTLTVQAPASAEAAPPGFYLAFLLAGDELYSDGRWVQLRPAAPAPLPGVVPKTASRLGALSADFEPTNNSNKGGGGAAPSSAVFRLVSRGGGSAAAVAAAAATVAVDPLSPQARAGGTAGLRVSLKPGAGATTAKLASAPAMLQGNKNCTLLLWARGAGAAQTLKVSVVATSADGALTGPAALPPTPLALHPGRHCQFVLPAFAPAASGPHALVLEADLAPNTAPGFDVDDVELMCNS